MPSVVLISGMSGSGKSTLAELLKTKYGWIHFDVDIWTVGRDPVAEAGRTVKPEDLSGAEEKVPEIDKLRKEFTAEVWGKVFTGRSAEIEVGPIERFYTPLVAKVKEVRAANPGKGIVLSRAVIVRHERDVLRTQLGDDLACVVLCCPPELLYNRRLERTKKEAADAGKTLEDHVMGYPAGIWPGETFEDRLKMLSKSIPVQEGEAGEPNTFNLAITEETAKDAMLSETSALLNLSSATFCKCM